jgi:hypothetical protein
MRIKISKMIYGPIVSQTLLKLTASNDSLAAGHLTVFLVHVVSTRARVVTEPDTVVLDLLRTLLEDLAIQSGALKKMELIVDSSSLLRNVGK